MPASLSIVLLKVASGRQSTGGVVVRPYMIKTNLFSSIVEHVQLKNLEGGSQANALGAYMQGITSGTLGHYEGETQTVVTYSQQNIQY